MCERLFDFFVETMMSFFIPLVCTYHILVGDLFFNVSVEKAPFMEKTADTILIPLQYLCDGKIAIQKEDGSWEFEQRFDYSTAYWPKTVGCIIVLPVSLTLGSLLKILSFCSETTRQNHAALIAAQNETKTITRNYAEIGIDLGDPASFQWLECQKYQRRPGDENHLDAMKRCLAEIGSLLNQAGIPWWVDCGTCLGALRYGGVIPWDDDIDIAILITDYENTRRALNKIDRTKYLVQDWSTRDIPKCFFKIYIRETGRFFDIYFYDIHPEIRQISYIFPLDTNIFFPDWVKERERRFTVPTSFESVFPLKRALFDGVEVFVPNDTVKFLQRYYGENLNPARIYDEKTGRYEKDLSHPYWKMAYVH